MADLKLGGPAYPHSRLGSDHDGMTLRDYFAAKAMPSYNDLGWDDEDVAVAAYALADAMLKARGKS